MLLAAVVLTLLVVVGGCELRFQDPFSHPADDADTRIFDDESGSGTASGDGSDGGADGDSGGDADGDSGGDADGDSGGDADEGPPYGGVIDFRTITVDGIGDDWDGVTSIIYDADGDSLYAGTGGDIVRLRLAADETFLYFSIELADDTPYAIQWISYGIMILGPDSEATLRLRYNGTDWYAYTYIREQDGTTQDPIPGFDPGWIVAGSPTGPIEYQIERTMVAQESELSFLGYIFSFDMYGGPVDGETDRTEEWLYTLP
jgi:hypothetical protein